MIPTEVLIALTVALAGALAVSVLLLMGARREQREMLRGLPTGLCIVDDQDRIQRWNGQMSQLSGISAQQALGEPFDRLPSPWPEAFRNAFSASEEEVIKQGLDDHQGGRKRWVVLHASTPRRGSRRYVLVDDITEYQHLQDEMLHNERLASIGRLAAGVAHEIGNPVTGIACVAQNLVETADPAELEQGTAEILKQTERITRTVGALMQLSHPGSMAQSAECVPCNLADCIDEAIHLLTLDRDASADDFVNHCDRELLVSGDSQLLLQVMLNLMDNARAAAAGEGPVSLSAEEYDGTVSLCIDNPGPIVPAEVLDQAFEPFFTTKDVGEGTGLGLPLVRRMLADMGGNISLISPVPTGAGDGTRARLTLAGARYEESFTGDP